MRKFGQKLTKQELNAVVAEVDTDGSKFDIIVLLAWYDVVRIFLMSLFSCLLVFDVQTAR